ncbi:unnamed protein product [Kuraishia capsulata CBS 1993]|uniref:tRNA-5-taurinomethyluridine 2-sulfurtransferase n=1 Tax=Kuraishia capsulata CBS 1993 TaxID=1382522 RepID=W6MQR8_9ASCO|nr:uncharacterized protein KUCA_T00000195001 [Kuraishia capsulata CBS 1993]CDK24235.1 unnamed protein product [Kuraishia capsulata CBS 1993]
MRLGHVVRKYLGQPRLVLPKIADVPGYTQPRPAEDDTIVVSMSSGVDSSVTAALYAQRYKNVHGIFMANWTSENDKSCTEGDWREVQHLCKQIGIPCSRVSFEHEYWADVFIPMIDMYRAGLTPNPDVGCNKYVKFGKMVEHLHDSFGDQGKNWWLATGHYARMMQHDESGQLHLMRGTQTEKDQSHYLSTIPHNAMSRLLFPLGHFSKPQVRQMASQMGLISSSKPDSQGLCFVSHTGNNFRDFLDSYIPENPGDIITEDGLVVGKHKGLWHATIGQKSGVSMPQGDPKTKGVWFVSEKRPETNELVIVRGGNNPSLFKNGLVVQDWYWLSPDLGTSLPPLDELTVQFRSLQSPIPLLSLFAKDSELKFLLARPYKGIAPGQTLVLYHGERVLGSGVITSTFDED